ncbi:TPA: hypothetical protein ACX6SX_001715 [Photobacterium damselae]
MFHKFLTHYIKNCKLSRMDLIAQLNLYHYEFYSLDSVTLSRWTTNKTTPSLYKQVLLCLFFKHDLYHFIKNKNYSINKSSLNFKNSIHSELKKIENSEVNISYYYNNSNNYKHSVNLNNHENYKSKFEIFYSHFDVYNKAIEYIEKNNINPNTVSIEHTIESVMVSHDSLTYINKEIKPLIEYIFEININMDNFWFSNIGHHRSTDSSKFSFCLAVTLLLQSKKYKYLSLVRGEDSLYLFIPLGYKQITNTIYDNDKLYLCEADILKVISNSFTISELSNYYNQYDILSFYKKDLLEFIKKIT